MLNPGGKGAQASGQLTDLVYELLDAHIDTLRLAQDLDQAPAWEAHLDYLRDLQRVSREALARLPVLTA
ncbi:MAG: hypothetical protein M3076_01185 [Actinomycetota bacterium]|nr:hypothetical protein [Actinomycetota bacterium]